MRLNTFVIEDDELLPKEVWPWLVKQRAAFRCEKCPNAEKLHAHHIDRDRTNNRLSNGQCLCTTCHHAVHQAWWNTGSVLKGWETKRANQQGRFTPEMIRDIRYRAANSIHGIQKQLAEEYGVSRQKINAIVNRRTWKWVE